MTVQVRIPCSLRKFVSGEAELALPPGDMGRFLAYLEEHHAPLYDCIHLADGRFRPFVKIFVNQTDVTAAVSCETVMRSGDVVNIVSAIAGG